MTAKLILDARTELGEGALWHPPEQRLYWVDIEGQALHIYDPAEGTDSSFPTGSRIGCVVPVLGGGALVALQTGIYAMDTDTGQLHFIANPLPGTHIRFNDGKCDPAGRFWVGTMELNTQKGAAALYRMDKDHSIHQMLDNVTISNGIVWTSDKKTMYYIDTPTGQVTVFDYDNAGGAIRNRRIAIRIPPEMGSPDGMTIDAAGRLWIALWGGYAVGCWDPVSGDLLELIDVPAPHVSSCAFGGPALDTLFITTARHEMDAAALEKYPLSGGLFAVQPGVRGVEAAFYEGNGQW